MIILANTTVSEMADPSASTAEPTTSALAFVGHDTWGDIAQRAMEGRAMEDSKTAKEKYDIAKAKRRDDDAKERRRRFHDRHMLTDTVQLDKAWVADGKDEQRAISSQRVSQIYRMFGAKMWPKSPTAWAIYDRDRDEAVKEIERAREMRGWGRFDLTEYLARAQGDTRLQSKEAGTENPQIGKQPRGDKSDPVIPTPEPLRFDETFTRALEEIEEEPLTFNASFKRALESDDDEEKPNDAKRPKPNLGTPKSSKKRNTNPALRRLCTRGGQGLKILRTMEKLIERKKDGRNHAVSEERQKEIRTLFMPSRLQCLVRAGNLDVDQEIQLLEAAFAEIDAAIQRLYDLESHERTITPSSRPDAGGRFLYTPPRHLEDYRPDKCGSSGRKVRKPRKKAKIVEYLEKTEVA